jgi:hypothetical protein
MANRNFGSGDHFSCRRKQNRLTFERLESRMMFALDGIDLNLQQLMASPSDVGQPVAPIVMTVSGTPTVTSPAAATGGSTVVGRATLLTVRATDNQAESNLRYSWQVVEGPTGAKVLFSANGNNVAKNTTATFDRAGQYTFRVTVTDRDGLSTTSEVQVNVVQTLTAITVQTTSGAKLISNSQFNATGSSLTLSAVGLDQFGAVMAQQPAITWQTMSMPTGASADLARSGNDVTVSFDRIGRYVLRASADGRLFNATLNVIPTLTSLRLQSSDGSIIGPDSAITTGGTTQRVMFRGIDQFGNVMAAVPQATVTTTRLPEAARLVSSVNSGTANLTFNRVGEYRIRIGVGTVQSELSVNVTATLTSIGVHTADQKILQSGVALTVATTSQQLIAVGMDQFGIAMAQQPQIAWQATGVPTGGNATLSPSGNGVTATMNRVGTYLLRATTAGLAFQVRLNVVPTLSTLRLFHLSGQAIEGGQPIVVSGIQQQLVVRGYDQFGNTMTLPPTVSTVTARPVGSNPSVRIAGSTLTAGFNRVGDYAVNLRSGTVSIDANFRVAATLTRVTLLTPENRSVTSAQTVFGTGLNLVAQRLDQFGQPMAAGPDVSWSVVSAPAGATASFDRDGTSTKIGFNRSGQYVIRASAGNVSVNVTVNVRQTLTSLVVTPGTTNLKAGDTQAFRLTGNDQFGLPMAQAVTPTWSATGGTITSTGVFTAGNQVGGATVTARVGTLVSSASIQIISPGATETVQHPALATLMQSFYADGQINRAEMIQLLRSVGADGVVDSGELADLRLIVSNQADYVMPAHVRDLARSVVHSNPANLRFQNQPLGNLVAGATAAHLNKLVDKWFLGADVPALTGAGISYQNAVGSLFVGAPSIDDARQGMLGDCYLIASLISIAQRNASAIQNMFIDNGDGTFTVRMFGGPLGNFMQNGLISGGFISGAGVASYVTVNRLLPAFSNGTLAYSGMGLSVNSASTPLWIALAEKAYAQWNETGKAGRDGTNRYASIEGGWMAYTNAQVLGYNSTNYPLSSTPKTTLINALAAGHAVTIGTNGSVAAGLVAGHAYVVTGYNSSTDRFTLFNPWGTTHPTPLTWQQLQSNMSMFVVTHPSGTVSGGNPAVVRSDQAVQLLGGSFEAVMGNPETGCVIVQLSTISESESECSPADGDESTLENPFGQAAIGHTPLAWVMFETADDPTERFLAFDLAAASISATTMTAIIV